MHFQAMTIKFVDDFLLLFLFAEIAGNDDMFNFLFLDDVGQIFHRAKDFVCGNVQVFVLLQTFVFQSNITHNQVVVAAQASLVFVFQTIGFLAAADNNGSDAAFSEQMLSVFGRSEQASR